MDWFTWFASIWSGIGGYSRDVAAGFVLRAQSYRKWCCEKRRYLGQCFCGEH